MRVLVTGATGFIGRLLVERLVAEGIQVDGFALEGDNAEFDARANRRGASLHVVDLRDTAAVAQQLVQIRPDRIIHLAAAGVTEPAIDSRLALEHNVNGTINLIHAAFQNRNMASRPRQLIVIRTPGEHHPANAYTASKAASWSFCQMYARRHHWPILGVMIFQAYGPNQPAHTFVQAALRAALAGEDFAMSSGKQIRDWIYISDVIEGLVAATRVRMEPGDSLDLGTGVGTALLDVAAMAYRLADRGGAPLTGAIPDRPGEEISWVANVARTTKLLDWKPQVNLGDGLQQVLDSLTVR